VHHETVLCLEYFEYGTLQTAVSLRPVEQKEKLKVLEDAVKQLPALDQAYGLNVLQQSQPRGSRMRPGGMARPLWSNQQ
jgi:hypothetical protein